MGDGGAAKAAKRAIQSSMQSQLYLQDQIRQQKEKAAKDAERAQRIMMRSMRGGGGGFYTNPGNNPTLNDSSGVLG